jgi:inward rectifier potassium channel
VTRPGWVSDDEIRDLGFGAVVARESRQRLLNRDGSFNVARKGLKLSTSLSLYHTLLTTTWTRFMALVVVSYIVINAGFALAFVLCGPGALQGPLAGAREVGFGRGFFFSVETFSTIGYGNIAPYRGIKAFEFRIANMRSSQLIEVEATVMFTRFEEQDGRPVRRFYQLPLERNGVAFFPLSWTIVHPIDEASPLNGLTRDDMRRSDTEFLVLLSGVEETFAQRVHARSSYRWDEVVWGAKFSDILHHPRGTEAMSLDVSRLDSIEPVA